jgi:hypothetical protein
VTSIEAKGGEIAIVPERQHLFQDRASAFDMSVAKDCLQALAAHDGYDLGFFTGPMTEYDITQNVEVVRMTYTVGRRVPIT